jgi:hypothetical protein
MGDGFSLLLMLIAAVLSVVGTAITISLRRSEPSRKWFYLLLTFNALGWVIILERLFALVDVPLAWQDGVEGALFALAGASLVLLYRHRHDPDPSDPDVP